MVKSIWSFQVYGDRCAKRFIEVLEQCPPNTKLFDRMKFVQVNVSFNLNLFFPPSIHKQTPTLTFFMQAPLQIDAMSCGWRVVTNAQRLINFIFFNENKSVQVSFKSNIDYTQKQISYKYLINFFL